MDVAHSHPDESETERKNRLAWETVCLAQAKASIEAGDVIPWERVEAWLDSLDTDQPLPRPRPVR